MVFGQDDAVRLVAQAIKRSRAPEQPRRTEMRAMHNRFDVDNRGNHGVPTGQVPCSVRRRPDALNIEQHQCYFTRWCAYSYRLGKNPQFSCMLVDDDTSHSAQHQSMCFNYSIHHDDARRRWHQQSMVP